MVIKQRAISNDEKQERREAILDAAEELLSRDDYHDISIARKAGLGKGTIFLYFKTKEKLFLQLQGREYKSWFEDINKQLYTLVQQKKKCGIDKFVENIAVVDDNNKLLGLITDGDLRRGIEKWGEDFFSLKAVDVMTHRPKTITKNMLAAKAVSIMEKNSITVLIVADEKDSIGRIGT